MSFGIPVRNGLGVGLLASTFLSSLRIGGRPAMFLDFIGTNSLDSRVTFTRASTATVTNSSGVIQSSAINDPRFDYDPVTLAPKGLLIEEQRINLLLNSLIDGTSLSTQSVTVTAVAHTISFYGTGTITLTGASVATVTGTGVYPNRRTLTFTPIVGVLVCTVTGSVQYAQLEAGGFATSFIPTAGTAVTRNADVAQMTGTNFTSWYNQTAGTLVVNASQPTIFASSRTAASLNYTVTGSRVNIYRQSVGGINGFVTPGVGALASGVNAIANTPWKAAIAYDATTGYFSANGSAVVTGTNLATLSLFNNFCIGNSSPAASEHFNGYIRTITYYNARLPNATLRVLTA